MSVSITRVKLTGISISPGTVDSKICLYSHRNYQKVALRIRKSNFNSTEELLRFEHAITYCEGELQSIQTRIRTELGSAEAMVIDAQLALLKDPAIMGEIHSTITNESVPFESAVEIVFTRYENLFLALENEYFQERSTDIGEVKRRLLNFGYKTEPGFVCSGQKACGKGHKSIIITEELTTSMLLEIDLSKVKGIITERGGVNGHAALIARSSGVPTVTGVVGAMDHARCGGSVLLDGASGVVIFNPIAEDYEAIVHVQKTETIETSATGTAVYANCSTLETVDMAIKNGADGIGLFRTEMLFLNQGKLLSEEEQIEIYRATARKFAGKPVTFRLLDIGGDKPFPFLTLPKEENPFLGFRGSRFLLGNRELLRTQLRALLIVAQEFPLKIMFPMIIDSAQLKELKNELFAQAQSVGTDRSRYEIGSMFEVPSAIFEAEAILSESDFGSIGSNDLFQYLFAVDRNNELVAQEYDMNHPALWHVMKSLSETSLKLRKPLSICGELASYAGYASKLHGIGITHLSVSPHLIFPVRQELNRATIR